VRPRDNDRPTDTQADKIGCEDLLFTINRKKAAN
jgi:hypothetical protein